MVLICNNNGKKATSVPLSLLLDQKMRVLRINILETAVSVYNIQEFHGGSTKKYGAEIQQFSWIP